MKRLLVILFAIVLMIAIAACSDKTLGSSSVGTTNSEEQDKTTEIASDGSEEQEQTTEITSSEEEPPTSSSSPPPSSTSQQEPTQNDSSIEEASSATEGSAIVTTDISVVPTSQDGPFPAFPIVDEGDQQLLLSYIGNMKPIDKNPVSTLAGGSIFLISVTQNGEVKEYGLHNSEYAYAVYILHDNKWYSVDYELWKLLLSYFPMFDLEKNRPVLVTLSPSRGGMAMLTYYRDEYFVLSQEEQEEGKTFMAYWDTLTELEGLPDDSITEKDYITIDIRDYEKDTQTHCKCYGSDEGSFVENNGAWSYTSPELYEYLAALSSPTEPSSNKNIPTNNQPASTEEASAIEALPAIVDYPVYDDLSELIAAADLVVRCTALSSEQADIEIGEDFIVPYVVTSVRISDVFKGDAAVNDIIDVKQLLQSADPSTGDDYLRIDQEYLLFLATYENVPSSLLNPTQAQYVIDESGNIQPHPAQYTEIIINSLDDLRNNENASSTTPEWLPDRKMIMRIVDNNGAPVVNAKVAYLGDDEGASPFNSIMSSADGEMIFNNVYLEVADAYPFRVDMPRPSGEVVSEEVTLSLDDLTSEDNVVLVTLSRESTEAEFLSAPNRLEVFLVDGSGDPVPNVLTSIEHPVEYQPIPDIGGPNENRYGERILENGFTNNDGRIIFTNIPQGRYSLGMNNLVDRSIASDFTLQDNQGAFRIVYDFENDKVAR